MRARRATRVTRATRATGWVLLACGALSSCDAGPDVADGSAPGAIPVERHGEACPADTKQTIQAHPSGAKEAWCETRLGRREGPYAAWWEGGAPWLRGEYRADVQHGWWVEWYANGRRKNEGRFVRGVPDGEWVHFDDRGAEVARDRWQRGVQLARNEP